MSNHVDKILEDLKLNNKCYMEEYKTILHSYTQGQHPKIAVLTCSDSRVIPEFIFNKSLGELFVVRIAGNIALDETVITSLEYAVDHLHVSHLIILGHTQCGAVKASECSTDLNVSLFNEIKESFYLNDKDHILANLLRQLEKLPKRSSSIKNAIDNRKLKLIGAIYHLNDGSVEFIDHPQD